MKLVFSASVVWLKADEASPQEWVDHEYEIENKRRVQYPRPRTIVPANRYLFAESFLQLVPEVSKHGYVVDRINVQTFATKGELLAFERQLEPQKAAA